MLSRSMSKINKSTTLLMAPFLQVSAINSAFQVADELIIRQYKYKCILVTTSFFLSSQTDLQF